MNSTNPIFKKISLILAILTQMYSASFGADLPQQVQRIVEKRQEAISKIDNIFVNELEKIKTDYTKAGDLDTANAIVAVIDGKTPGSRSNKRPGKIYDELVNTSWEYHHKSAIFTFDLKRSDLLRARAVWGDAKWRLVSDNEIIIEHPNGAKMVMTFDKAFKTFYGSDWDGTSVTGTRVSK